MRLKSGARGRATIALAVVALVCSWLTPQMVRATENPALAEIAEITLSAKQAIDAAVNDFESFMATQPPAEDVNEELAYTQNEIEAIRARTQEELAGVMGANPEPEVQGAGAEAMGVVAEYAGIAIGEVAVIAAEGAATTTTTAPSATTTTAPPATTTTTTAPTTTTATTAPTTTTATTAAATTTATTAPATTTATTAPATTTATTAPATTTTTGPDESIAPAPITTSPGSSPSGLTALTTDLIEPASPAGNQATPVGQGFADSLESFLRTKVPSPLAEPLIGLWTLLRSMAAALASGARLVLVPALVLGVVAAGLLWRRRRLPSSQSPEQPGPVE